MNLYKKILKNSKKVDTKFSKLKKINNFKIKFIVPKSHKRYKDINYYYFSNKRLEDMPFYKNKIFIIDKSIIKLDFVKSFIKKEKINKYFLDAIENKIKTESYLDNFIKKNKIKKSTIVVIGGGLLCNCGLYIAEKTSSNIVLFPTTILAMADGALGGKVRANLVKSKKYYKHHYKSFYEPNAVFLDERFIHSLPKKQKLRGLVEIIKVALFQSKKLYKFLLKNPKELLESDYLLKKAILWAANLKQICISVDPKEHKDGAEVILRAGHDFSDKIEEENQLNIPHGFAVAIGITQQLSKNKKLLKESNKIFNKFKIPKTVNELKRLR